MGSTESLSSRYAVYEVHFTCRTRYEIIKARALMALILASRMVDDVATRFEVPILLTFLPCRQSVGKFFPAYRSVPKKFTRQAPIRGKSPDHSKTPPNPPFMLKQKHAPYHPVPGKSVHAQPTVCDVTTRCHCHPPHPPQPSLTSAPH